MSYSKRLMDEMNKTSIPDDDEDESYRLIEDVYNQPEYGSEDYEQ